MQERHRIDVDCRRTDRTQPLFASKTPTLEVTEDEKYMHMRFSTISPGLSDIGAQAPSNEHIERLGGILLTYNLYDKDLGTCISQFWLVSLPLKRLEATCRECRTFVRRCML